MCEENVVYINNRVLLSFKEQNYVICRKMDETGDHNVKQNNPDPERQVSRVFYHMQN
jgi:hypothetical protein